MKFTHLRLWMIALGLVYHGTPAIAQDSSRLPKPQFRSESSHHSGVARMKEIDVTGETVRRFTETVNHSSKKLEVSVPLGYAGPPLQIKKRGSLVVDELALITMDKVNLLHEQVAEALNGVKALMDKKAPPAGLNLGDLFLKINGTYDSLHMDVRHPVDTKGGKYTFHEAVGPVRRTCFKDKYTVRDDTGYWKRSDNFEHLRSLESQLQAYLKPESVWVYVVANDKGRVSKVNERWELLQGGKIIDTIDISGVDVVPEAK